MAHKKIVYADGSSLGNPGRGGWAFLVIDEGRKLVWEFGGREEHVTNNQMELRALIESFKQIGQSKFVGEVELRLDSEYVIKGVTQWSKGWVKNGWKTAAKKDVLNKEYWMEILDLKQVLEKRGFTITFKHIYGHSGEVWNERVDEIARGCAAMINVYFRQGEKLS